MDTISSQIKNHFKSITDPRKLNANRRHDLLEMIVLVLIAVICGADGWTHIEEFGRSRLSFLKSFLTLENGIPSHDTLGDVFGSLNPDEFRECFISWVKSIMQVSEGRIIAIDGKALRGSRTQGRKSAITLVSAWCAQNQLVLGQYKVDSKSNEITAIPKLLDVLDIRKSIVTIDAMGCQRKIAEKIILQGGDYVFGLKGNQGHLHDTVKRCFTIARSDNYEKVLCSTSAVVEKDHGRIETRKCHVLPLMYAPLFKAKWRGLQSLVCIESEIDKGGCIHKEQRYYISSLKPCAKKIARAIRAHWGIENQLHWCLDVAFNEDHCRVRQKNAAENLAIIRHYALNMLKQETSTKVGLQIKRNKAGWSEEYLAKVLANAQF